MTMGKPDRVVDARLMEPPEPFIQTMEALDALEPEQTLLLQVGREPFPLYRALELNGFCWQTAHQADGSVEVLMWHKAK